MFRVSCFLILAWTALAGDVAIFPAFAAENAPRAPMAPPIAQAKKIPDNPFRCDRLIKYRGRVLPCDSALRRDGDSLRSIFEKSPEALDELDEYQSGRNSLRYSAYVGTAGLVLALTSGLLANAFIDENHPTGRKDTAKVIQLGGLGITLGSVLFGLSKLRNNEEHLQTAIIKYNATSPDRPIEVLFKSDF
jgi:hypothetical protein